jgi:5-hydroxyisourate hydrolase
VADPFARVYALAYREAQSTARKPLNGNGRRRIMANAGPGRLTTHVLDTALGKPAAGLSVTLYRCEGDSRVEITSAVTNADGRCDKPLLEGEAFRAGEYELVFAAGDYLRKVALMLVEPPFLDTIPIRFGMTGSGHYHVPLLLSPFGYSTYRGS